MSIPCKMLVEAERSISLFVTWGGCRQLRGLAAAGQGSVGSVEPSQWHWRLERGIFPLAVVGGVQGSEGTYTEHLAETQWIVGIHLCRNTTESEFWPCAYWSCKSWTHYLLFVLLSLTRMLTVVPTSEGACEWKYDEARVSGHQCHHSVLSQWDQ